MTEINDNFSDMETTVRGVALTFTRYDVDGSKGGSIWIQRPNSGRNPDNLGFELLKIKIPYELFDQQKAKLEEGDFSFPTSVEILCDVVMGSQNKSVLWATSVRHLPPIPSPSSVNTRTSAQSGTPAAIPPTPTPKPVGS